MMVTVSEQLCHQLPPATDMHDPEHGSVQAEAEFRVVEASLSRHVAASLSRHVAVSLSRHVAASLSRHMAVSLRSETSKSESAPSGCSTNLDLSKQDPLPFGRST